MWSALRRNRALVGNPLSVQVPKSLLRIGNIEFMKLLGMLIIVAAYLCAASSASAYRLLAPPRPYPGPVVYYYNQGTAYGPQLAALQKAVNAKRVGVTLRRTNVRSRAHFIVRYAPASWRFSCRGGTGGIGGTGGVALARDCRGQEAMLLVAHEVGHAIGLDHDNRQCATMNSRYTIYGTNPVPNKCSRITRNWYTTPYLRDDIAGLRARWANHAPIARLAWREGNAGIAGETMIPEDNTVDRDKNLVYSRLDWGDGSAPISRTIKPYENWSGWAGFHTYMLAGTYTVTLTARDSYGATSTVKSTITITGEVVDLCSNLDGIQMQIPAGTYPALGECLPVP